MKLEQVEVLWGKAPERMSLSAIAACIRILTMVDEDNPPRDLRVARLAAEVRRRSARGDRPARMLCVVESVTGVPVELLCAATRRAPVAEARAMVMGLAHRSMGQEKAAALVGRVSHATALHALRSLKDADPESERATLWRRVQRGFYQSAGRSLRIAEEVPV